MTVADEHIVSQILASHQAYDILDKASQRLQQEARQRQAFYALIHENVKAEFINGQTVMHSPVRGRHWMASINISTAMHTYVKQHKLGLVGVEKVMISLSRNDYEPDIVFFNAQKSSSFTRSQMLYPAPDLVVEILSERTEATDRTIKFEDYAAHGIAEYWIVDAELGTLEQYLHKNGSYYLHVKLAREGLLHCKTIPGFVLNIAEVFSGDVPPPGRAVNPGFSVNFLWQSPNAAKDST